MNVAVWTRWGNIYAFYGLNECGCVDEVREHICLLNVAVWTRWGNRHIVDIPTGVFP